jgi:hypothetical protein
MDQASNLPGEFVFYCFFIDLNDLAGWINLAEKTV